MRLQAPKFWYQPSLHPLAVLLMPLSWLFQLGVLLRRLAYRFGLLTTYAQACPVIVVGNISVGGTGKTPFVIWLAQFLKAAGYHPGIVSRGCGGKKQLAPHHVQLSDEPDWVGDEALLLKAETECPVVICVDRAKAAEELVQRFSCNIILSDDGLQHYRLKRDLEIVMVDAARGFGNRLLLPAGPLRESVRSVQTSDIVIHNGKDMTLEPLVFVSLSDAQRKINFVDFPRGKVHAVAGIGHPERFFDLLTSHGFDVVPHVFPDHHLYEAGEIIFADGLPVVMTEKDAVKVKGCGEGYWYLKVGVRVSLDLERVIREKVGGFPSPCPLPQAGEGIVSN